MMDFEVSDNSKFASVKKMDTTTLPVKRLFDNNNSLEISNKKLKVSPFDDQDKDEDDIRSSNINKRPGKSADNLFSSLRKELALVKVSFEECNKNPQVEERRLRSIKRAIEKCCKELENKETQAKELEARVKDFESEKTIFESRQKEFESKENELEGKVKEFQSKEEQFKGQMKAKEKEFEGKVKEYQLKEEDFKGQVKVFEAKEKKFEGIVKEYQSKEVECKGKVKKYLSKVEEFKGIVKEYRSKEVQCKGKVKKYLSKVEEFKGIVKEYRSKGEEFKGQVEVFEAKEKKFEGKVKEYQSKEVECKGKVKKYLSKVEEFKGKVKEYRSKEEEIIGQLKVFEAKEEEFKSKEKQCENQVEDILKFVKDNIKVLQLKENELEVQIKDLESKLNNSGGQLKELELIEKQYDDEKEFDTSYMDDQFSITIDGTSAESKILDNLRESSDPAKIILDIILNPISPLPKKGDKVVLIDESRIYLLEQLMMISPNIKSCVRDEALRLAHELKANMKENTENSLEVLGFLLILSIYGLLTYFNEDEVLKLFASVAEYKIAVELVETLGLSN